MLVSKQSSRLLLGALFLHAIYVLCASEQGGDQWQGRWFPYTPLATFDDNPDLDVAFKDAKHGVVMGVINSQCDDGQTNLQIDWDRSPLNYTCYIGKSLYRSRCDIPPVLTTDHIPTYYSAHHQCMNKPIEYSARIPTFGTHRPLWARYGEYTFLPKQRWLHNLEHGALVMLYHPCADRNQVSELRNLVTKCLYRHIITPYTLLTTTHPLALVTWGKRLEMSKVAPEIVIKFIKENALRGPERLSKDGQFSVLLQHPADVVSDQHDQDLCPNYHFIQ